MCMISIIVPVFNVENQLNRCINSILDQTFQEFEILLIDDGSTDKSGILCDEYAENDKRIRVIHQTNSGQACARNVGIRLSKGEWIVFVDSDDMIHPQLLEILYSSALKHKVKISACDAYEADTVPIDFFDNQVLCEKLYPVDEANLYNWRCTEDSKISKYLYWVIWGKLIHKSILDDYMFTEGRIYEDNAIVCKWLYASETIVYCNNVLYYYYVNPDGTTKKPYSLKQLDFLWALQQQIDFYKDKNMHMMVNKLQEHYVWRALREYKNVMEMLGDKKNAHKLRLHIVFFMIKNKIFKSRFIFCEALSQLYIN